METRKDTEALKSVYDMRVSHSNMNTRPISQPRGKRKHLQSAVTRTMAPKLTMPDDSELSGVNLLPPMAPSINRQPLAAGTQNLVADSGTGSISHMMNQTSHTVLPHQRARGTAISSTMGKGPISKETSRERADILVKGNSSIRTLIRLANSRNEDEDDEVEHL